MPSPQVIDVSSLLEPISADNAVGLDLRQDTTPRSIYSRIRDARKAARAAERSNLFDDDSTEADEHWRQVYELAPQALKTNSKDLEIACWFTESLIRKAGFSGLRDGFSLIHQLIEKYWDNLYPLPDEDGIETRVAALTGLNGEGAEGVLIAPIRTTRITEGTQVGPFSYWQYKQALDAQRITDDQARGEQISKNGFSLDNIQNAVEQSSQEFYVNLRDDVRDALEEYKRIGQLLIERCGVHDSPPTSNIVNILTDTLSAITHIARHKLPEPEPEAGIEGSDAAASVSTTGGAINSRAEALRQLSNISLFFRRTEPHSPLSYIIEKAVRWGDMSLGELMQELIPDSGSRNTYSSLTGVSTNDQ